MQIGGIAWWLLIGMFGWGAGVGFLISLFVGRRLFKSMSDGWWGPLFALFFTLIGMVIIPLLAGIVAVALAFVAHRIGWDQPLPYLAGIGFVSLIALAGFILWLIYKPSSTQCGEGDKKFPLSLRRRGGGLPNR